MKKPIKLELTDACKLAIQAELDDINGRATAFTVCSAESVFALAARAELYLADHGIPISDRAAAKVTLRPAGPTANSYKYGAVSTEVTLRRRAGGLNRWVLEAVERASVYPRNPERFAVMISDLAARNAVKRTLAAFGRDVVPRELLAPADDAAIAGLAA